MTKNFPKKTDLPLKKHLKTDVVIVGGGLTGLLSAYLLRKSGKSIILLEKGKIGRGATALTTAFITQVIDTPFSELITIFGLMSARRIVDSHGDAIVFLKNIIRDEKMDCDFTECSNFLYAHSSKEITFLKKECAAEKKLHLDATCIQESNLSFESAGYIETRGQAKFDAQKFVAAFIPIVQKMGVRILENTEALSITSDGQMASVETVDLVITAPWTVVTTYAPFNKPLRLFFKKAMYTSYVMKAEIPGKLFKEGIYEDTQNPYHYFRVDIGEGKDTITIGGEDHRSDIPASSRNSFLALEDYAKKILPMISYKKISCWKGPILESVDGLAYIGPLDTRNVLYAMAFSGNGMTYAAISALIFRDSISGKKNNWSALYKADRIPTLKSLITKGKDFAGEFIHGALKNTLRV